MPGRLRPTGQKKRHRPARFNPTPEEMKKASEIYPYKYQIADHFNVSLETLHAFFANEEYKEETISGYKSEILDAYNSGKNKTRKFVLGKLLKGVNEDNPVLTIFASKTYGGLLEKKDLSHIHLKKAELHMKKVASNLKVEEYVLKLKENLNLTAEQMKIVKKEAKNLMFNLDNIHKVDEDKNS